MGQAMELEALIAGVAQTTLAGKLRALMPVIDQRIKDGVSHQEIIDALNRHGGFATQVKLQTFRSYLFRYRKKTSATSDEALRKRGTAARGAQGTPVARSTLIRNASDLRRLRNEEVDLEALSRIGRNQGRG